VHQAQGVVYFPSSNITLPHHHPLLLHGEKCVLRGNCVEGIIARGNCPSGGIVWGVGVLRGNYPGGIIGQLGAGHGPSRGEEGAWGPLI
jgi:hypothetical protein